MLKTQGQTSKEIESKLQDIHQLVTRAICPPLPKDDAAIEQARNQYEAL